MITPSRFLLLGAAAAAVVAPAASAANVQSANQAKCTAKTAGAAVGDSALWMAVENYGQKGTLQRALGGPMAKVDTKTGRQFSEGITTMRSVLGTKPCAVVIALGTNGPVKPQQWREMMAVVKRAPRVVVVNTYTKDHRTRRDGQQQFWMEQVNRDIARLSRSNKNVRVVDWYRVASRRSSVQEPDGVHPSAR
ncbi:MAG: hypothetical protein O3B97_00865, partial [Actinomycetota bacterium]|nr:hypothetical protein [Actinomycetota bacterium]